MQLIGFSELNLCSVDFDFTSTKHTRSQCKQLTAIGVCVRARAWESPRSRHIVQIHICTHIKSAVRGQYRHQTSQSACDRALFATNTRCERFALLSFLLGDRDSSREAYTRQDHEIIATADANSAHQSDPYLFCYSIIGVCVCVLLISAE